MKPFIHTIETNGKNQYIYDVNLDLICQINSNEKEKQIAFSDLKKIGLLSSNRIKEIKNPYINYIDDILKSKLNMAILQVTQQCNLRCEYCIYSGKYKNARTHDSKRMTFETAKKSIDFLISNSKDTINPAFGFYGGEPLLEFELIKKCVEYIETKYAGKEYIYSITTNATLLTLEKADFFQKHNFNIMVSIDGPKETHDKNRKFCNQSGSFETVIANLKKISEVYPEYYEKVTYSAVIDHSCAYEQIHDFFTDNEFFSGKSGKISEISGAYENELTTNIYFSENQNKERFEEFKWYLSMLGRYDKNKVLTTIIRNNRFNSILYRDDNTTKLPSVYAHHGVCIPGASKLFINIEGKFYICEKASEFSEVMNIGDVNNGFDRNKVIRLLESVNLVEEDCKECWAIRYCSICAVLLDDITCLSLERNKHFCSIVRRDIDIKMRDYCTLHELGFKKEDR